VNTNYNIDKYVVHHSASSVDTTVDEIRSWHVDGNGWEDIGYHFVITQEGLVNKGRDVCYVPAAQKGFNTGSIAICLTGDNTSDTNKWNRMQMESLMRHYLSCRLLFPGIELYGHRDLNQSTICPGLNIRPMFLGPNFGVL
tara:strand:- start:1811 stop:2233 length:423 start_codon:yes stop_codon:yes gene_type:complete